jgi:glycine betaine/proline transport system substrate-binding protein
VTGNHQVTDAGLEGPNGNIGWYVPTYLMKAHPELATWKGVQKDWKMFVTPQSSPQGQFLDGSASYVTNDQALITNLKINLKVVFAGTEAAQLTEIESDYKAKKPVLFYWYTPQFQNALYKFSQVALPPWTTTCAKLKPAQINCAYPPYHLYKVMSPNLAKTAPSVANFIKRFNWTSDDQNSVAYDLAVKHMSNSAAAAAFVNSHQALVKSWLSGSTPFTKTEAPASGT